MYQTHCNHTCFSNSLHLKSSNRMAGCALENLWVYFFKPHKNTQEITKHFYLFYYFYHYFLINYYYYYCHQLSQGLKANEKWKI